MLQPYVVQHSFGGLDPSNTDTTDGAVAWESTPSSTQYNPQQETVNAQAVSGNFNASPQPMSENISNDDLMAELLESNLRSPQLMKSFFTMPVNGGEPNNGYPASGNLGFGSTAMASQKMDPGQGIGAWDLHDTHQPVAYTQTSEYPGGTYHTDGSTNYSRIPDNISAAIAPMHWQQEDRRRYTWDQGKQSVPAIPRYEPDSRTGPWSQYEIDNNQMRDQPSSEESLFAFGADVNAFTQSPFVTPHYQAVTEQCIYPMSQATALPTVTATESEDDHDTIDRPPPDNPVGPPPQFVSKGPKKRCLNPAQRANAAQMRNIRSCWNCALLKYSCNDGRKCERCARKRPTSVIWECDRTYLPDLTNIFIPASLTGQHQPEKLREFCKAQVMRWTKNHFTVYMTWGYGMPIRCEVHEIEPRGDDLLFQNQYRLNLTTTRYDLHKVPSPPLGIMLLDVLPWRGKLNRYLDNLLQTEFDNFPGMCFRGSECAVQRDLLYPMHAYHLESNRIPLPRWCLKLIVITHIMTHCLTLTEDTRANVYSSLNNRPDTPYGPLTCPRWLNKELKFLMSKLHIDLTKHVLELLHKNLRDCKEKRLLWAAAFIGLLTLTMLTESMQVSIRCKEETDKDMGTLPRNDSTAESDIKLQDETLDRLMRIFWKKYSIKERKDGKANVEFNPVKDLRDRDLLDEPARMFARDVDRVIGNYRHFLQSRKDLAGPPSTPNEPRTSRLVAKFLLSFYRL